MNFDVEQWLKLAQNLSFTGFLLLCVGVLAYALYRLYLYSRIDWLQVQQNAIAITQLNQNMVALIGKIDQLVSELHASSHVSAAPSSFNARVTSNSTNPETNVASHL